MRPEDRPWFALVILLVVVHRTAASTSDFALTALWSVWLALLVCAFRFLVALDLED